ncbi:MAG: hypothetical protein KAI45_02095 [Melioribacteraceae bacterium]|nr:hypothetical protein [Melioribacteraceae bacterium]
MDILLETPYYNCSLAFTDVKLNNQDYFECLAVVNSGWLSCERPLTFSRNDGKKFVAKIKKINKPFKMIAVLEDTYKNIVIKMESTAPGMVMVSGEFIEHSEFTQQATFGFNIEKVGLNEFLKQMDSLLEQNS